MLPALEDMTDYYRAAGLETPSGLSSVDIYGWLVNILTRLPPAQRGRALGRWILGFVVWHALMLQKTYLALDERLEDAYYKRPFIFEAIRQRVIEFGAKALANIQDSVFEEFFGDWLAGDSWEGPEAVLVRARQAFLVLTKVRTCQSSWSEAIEELVGADSRYAVYVARALRAENLARAEVARRLRNLYGP